MKKENQYQFGMIGLGTMGSNLLLNIIDHGFSGAGYDKDPGKVSDLNGLNQNNLKGFPDINNFINCLQKPRTIMLLVPAGIIVDAVITELLPLLDKGDVIIDGGNSYFRDTERRYKELEEQGFNFIGMGVSGGEEGARKGPSMMPGGNEKAYLQIKPILEKIAAQVDGEPTVTYIGRGAAGHFVKMVHNGIEYALMQIIAETYEVLNRGLQLDNEAIHKVFQKWNKGRLQSFLLEITEDIFTFKKPGEDHLLLDDIKDEAKAKGTGKWTSQVAMDINLPISVIDTAVSMRDLSKYKSLRMQASEIYADEKDVVLSDNSGDYIKNLEQAFYFCMVTAYAQGMQLLSKASTDFKYELELDQIAKIWRGGCIIRSAFLENIYDAFQSNKDLEHLLLDPDIQVDLKKSLPGIRKLVSDAAKHGFALPAYSASLSYFDAFRSKKLPANLIQAQRDYFGAHTYELIGEEGVFHTEWQSEMKKLSLKGNSIS